MATDEVLIRAMERRDAALAEVRQWTDFIKRYQLIAPGSQPVVDQPNARSVMNVGGTLPPPKGTVVVYTSVADTERAAERILEEAGRPLSSRELLHLLDQRGVNVGGKEPLSTLGARLNRAANIVGKRGSGWTLKKQVVQEAGAASSEGQEDNLLAAPDEAPNNAVMRGEVAHDHVT